MHAINRQSVVSFDTYAKDVYGWAYRLLGRHHDALDVVQDVFLKWHRQCGLNPPTQPRGWLRRTTINRAIDLRRQKRPDTDLIHDQAVAAQAASTVTVGEAMDREVLRAEITIALEKLTDVQRCVLVAKVYDGLTFSSIATETGLALSTVKTHYLRAIRSVRDKLSPKWSEGE